MVKLSVIICTINRSEDLQETLESIDSQPRLPDELVIVDQSTDDSTERLSKRKRPYPVRYIRQEEKSLTAARNRGVDNAKGDVLVFLDDDVTLERDYLAECASAFSDPQAAAVTGYVTNYFDPLGPKWIFIVNKYYNWLFANDFLNPYACGARGVFGNTYPVLEPKESIECSTLSGCNFAVRRDVFETNDMCFDEQLVRYSFKEDADFGYRLYKSGAKILLDPRMRLVHRISPAGRITPITQLKMRYAYFFYLFFKNVSESMLYFYWSLTGDILKRTALSILTLNFKELHHTYTALGFALSRLEEIRALDLKAVNEMLFP